MNPRLPQPGGFTLIEALVAAVVLGVGIAGLLPLVFGSVQATRAARDASTATWLAWQKLEDLRTPIDPPQSPANSLAVDVPGFVDYLDEAGRDAGPPGLYVRRWLVASAPDADVLRLVVTVHHTARPGTPVTVATVRRQGAP
jgi:prepilin-type N-terminal cleavage/methylation domain-containing protein